MDHSLLPEPGCENAKRCISQEVESTLTTHQQFFHLRNMHDLSMGMAGEDFSVLKQFHLMENPFAVTSGRSENGRKRDASVMQAETYDRDVHKRLRLETCGISDQNISNFNEEKRIDLGSRRDISETSSLIALADNGHRYPQSLAQTVQDPSLCFLCKKKISEHWDSIYGKEFYRCCVCHSYLIYEDSITGHTSLHGSVSSYS